MSSKKVDRQAHQKAIANALQYLEEHEESERSVARRFGIAPTTFQRAIANGVPARRGPPKVLTDEEECELVGYCLNLQKLGFGLTRNSVNYSVMQIAQIAGRDHPFADGEPGQAWWTRFFSDHPSISFRTPRALTAARAQTANPVIVYDHFKNSRIS